MYKKVKGGKVILPDSDQTADMYDLAVELLDSHGFHRYEVSNFAIDGYECRHNLNYWERGEYLGLGLAAHGYFNGVRYANVRRLENYYNKISVATRPVSSGQKITQKDACFEYVMLGLRKTAGFSVDEFKRNTGADFLTFTVKNLKNFRNKDCCVSGKIVSTYHRSVFTLQTPYLRSL